MQMHRLRRATASKEAVEKAAARQLAQKRQLSVMAFAFFSAAASFYVCCSLQPAQWALLQIM
jgi:hypothetical protein